MKSSINENISIWVLLGLMVVAYLFSIGVRMYWPLYFADTMSMYYNGQLMINTNDGYFFASGAKDIIDGVTPENLPRISAFTYTLSIFTAYITMWTPFSLDTVILYLPSIISSLIVIPIILTGRLMGHTFLGFLAALIGSIAWSYYNRTMVGYYDSDMFAIFLQFMMFYSFIYIIYKKNLNAIVFSVILILIYPYFYDQGLSITYVMFVMFLFYMLIEYLQIVKVKETNNFKKNGLSFYSSIILLSISLMITLPITLRIGLLLLMFFILIKVKLKENHLIYLSLAFFIGFLLFGNIIGIVLGKLFTYIDRGVQEEGLHFYQVIQTVREAGSIPMSTVANRISGSSIGLILSFIGYGILVWRHKPFIIALPLIGVGLFAYIGGLRFTVYAVPIAAMSVVYLFWIIGSLFKDKIAQYAFLVLATVAMLYPNITHIIGYKVPTVMNKTEVTDLVKLNKISDRKDYTLAWWDYGYPIWYYSDTSTLIDGGKHQNDNYIISKLMFSTSPQQVANLSKLAVETYVESGYKVVADTLFHNKQKEQKNPNNFMKELENPDYKLPKNPRDVYLYLPYRMMRIFPTVGVFGNLNLKTGKAKRNIMFYPTQVSKQNSSMLQLANGIVINMLKGEIMLGQKSRKINYFDTATLLPTGETQVKSRLMHMDGDLCVVYLNTYRQIIVMDKETYNSAYVQMFMLGKYDKNLFELVVSSAYSKIYKVK